MLENPDVGYATTEDGVYLAYQTFGHGPADVAWHFDWLGNIDVELEYPVSRAWYGGLTSFARVILHDKRGTGLSSRNVHPPNLETRVEDLRVVLDAVGADRPVLAAIFEGGGVNVLFAATYPERVQSLVWWSPQARSTRTPDYPWGYSPDAVEAEQRLLDVWGTPEYGRGLVEEQSKMENPMPEEDAARISKQSRQTCTPDVARELSTMWLETDVRGILPSVQAPTLLLAHEGSKADIAAAEYIANLMPRAEVAVFPGEIQPRLEDVASIVDLVRRFIGAEQAGHAFDTILATVVFTDIVGSTEKQAALGDRAWKTLVERHHEIVRECLDRWRGSEMDTAGDGFYATFDGPARAIRCALDVTSGVRELGLEVRAGLHTGECELIDGKVGGLAVSIGARVAAHAGASEVLVSQTVKDLVAGSGFTFHDAGEHELKGVPDRWHLHRVVV